MQVVLDEYYPFPYPMSFVLLFPNFPFNLISIRKLTSSSNCVITSTSYSFLIQDRSTEQTTGVGIESSGLYYLQSPTSVICATTESPSLLNCLLGHSSLSNLKKMVYDFPHLESLQCEMCQLGKHVRVSFSSRINNRPLSLFNIVHSDMWGPSHIPYILGYMYYVIFIDDLSRRAWMFLKKDHFELFTIFKIFCYEIST